MLPFMASADVVQFANGISTAYVPVLRGYIILLLAKIRFSVLNPPLTPPYASVAALSNFANQAGSPKYVLASTSYM